MKPAPSVKSVVEYLASLPPDRRKAITTVRKVVRDNIPTGYSEMFGWGMIMWGVPLSRYPDTYNKQPLCYVALASQKNYCSLYLMGCVRRRRPACRPQASVRRRRQEARHGKVLRAFPAGR